MKNSVVDFCWEDVVIGACLGSARFACDNNFFLIKNRDPHYHSYENKEEEWAQKIYELYNAGRLPMVEKITGLRVDPEARTVKILTDYENLCIKYNKLHLFDLDNVFGLENFAKTTLVGYRVLDWFDARGLGNPDISNIDLDHNFVRNIRFFKSCRLDGDQPYKDLVCESFLTENELKNVEYTDTMSRFKILSVLEQHGLGSVKLKLWKRDVYPVKETIYKEQNSIFWRR